MTSAADVLALLERRIAPLTAETVPLAEAAGRVLAEAIVSSVNVPAFARAAMDGYALRVGDAGELRLVGESLPGRPFAGTVQPNEAVRITTGAPIPTGADAVVMIERTEPRERTVLVHEAVAAWKNVVRAGEDVSAGSEVFPARRVLRPQDVGLLAAIGVARVNVIRRPRVAIIVTGNEILPPGSVPAGSQIVDSNSPMLAALVARDGGVALGVRYAPDDLDAIRAAVSEASTQSDLLFLTGGTSVGSEDHAARAVASLGELAVHGVAIRPGRPMGVGFLPRPVFLIPGNPVACLCVYDLFAGRVVRRLGGRSWELPNRVWKWPLLAAIHSKIDRVDYLRVAIAFEHADLAIGGASSLSSVVRADGFVVVPAEREQFDAGELVEVHLYDS